MSTNTQGEASGRPGGGRRPRQRRALVIASVSSLLCLLGLIAVSSWVLVPYRITGGSMLPTLAGRDAEHGGDIVLVNRLSYLLGKPRRWDIVVVRHDPSGEADRRRSESDRGAESTGAGAKDRKSTDERVKRIVGLPGEVVEIRGGLIHVGGVPLKPPESIAGVHVVSKGRFGLAPVKLGEDEYFLLGDNSYLSSDSRSWGPARLEEMQGRVVWICWPLERVGGVR